jgi:hypothetical protein
VTLAELQRATVELCFGPEPHDEQLSGLGDARIWRIYRDAVRKRLRGELSVALPRTCALLGHERVDALFGRFLRTDPPRTRFFHAVVGSFSQAALPWLRADVELPAASADLCAYEAARWSVGDLCDDPDGPVLEFEFERVPVFTPALRLLELRHAVHLSADEQGAYGQGEFTLCVYRKRDERQARYFALNPVTYALMQRWVCADEPVARSIERVAAERSVAVDQAFLDGLCTVLSDFLERGVLLGGR